MVGLLLPLRIVQAVLGLAVLALSSYVAQWYDRETLTPSPTQFNYLLYVALLSVISAAYLHFAPTQWPLFTHPSISFFLEVTNTILLFAGFVALAKFLGDLKFCRGNVCLAAKFDVALSALAVVAWLLTAVLLGRQVLSRFIKAGARRGRYGPVGEMTGV